MGLVIKSGRQPKSFQEDFKNQQQSTKNKALAYESQKLQMDVQMGFNKMMRQEDNKGIPEERVNNYLDHLKEIQPRKAWSPLSSVVKRYGRRLCEDGQYRIVQLN